MVGGKLHVRVSATSEVWEVEMRSKENDVPIQRSRARLAGYSSRPTFLDSC
jgi:hypothetical protein